MTYTVDEIRQHRQLTLDSLRRTGPEHFNMSTWFAKPDPFDNGAPCALGLEEVDHVDLRSCGTTACFGGHGALAWSAADPDGFSTDVFQIHAWLGLTPDAEEDMPMFFATHWPEGLQDEVDRLVNTGMPVDEAEWNVLVLWLSHEIDDSVKVPW